MANPTAIENNDLSFSLTDVARSTGWTLSGDVASHVDCNSGNLYLLNYPITAGESYEYSYNIITLSSGVVVTVVGNSPGEVFTAPQFVHETVEASNSDGLFIYSDGTASITNFTIRLVHNVNDNRAQNTISFSEKTKKWVSFYTYIPEMAMSMFTKIYSGFNGDVYVHEVGSDDRNEFYGVQYQSIIKFVDNVAPAVPKTFMSLSMQSNVLMITTTDGITTSLGQVSELAAVDFVKDFISDGVSQVNVQAVEGVFSANLNRDTTSGTLETGDSLKGNWLQIELISVDGSASLALYTVNIVAKHSAIGSR